MTSAITEPDFGVNGPADDDDDDFDIVPSEFVKMDHMVPVSKDGPVKGALILVYPREEGEKISRQTNKPYAYIASDVVVLTPEVDGKMIPGPFPYIIENVHMQGVAVTDKLRNQMQRRPGRPVLQRVYGQTINGRKDVTDRWYGFNDPNGPEDIQLGRNGAAHYKANLSTPFDS